MAFGALQSPWKISALALLFLSMFCLSQAGWQLVWNDEFTNTTSLNLDKWNTFYMMAPGTFINNELQYYTPYSFSFCSDFVSLVANNVSTWAGQNYTSALINTRTKYSTTYGYFELKARMPIGKGYWPAFWLYPENMPANVTTEMDILEILSGHPETLYMTYHCNSSVNPQTVFSNATLADGRFHTYGFQWNPDVMIWYIDGIERARVTSCVPNIPVYVLVNLAVGGSWGGPPNATTPYPASVDVSYVRVYNYVSSGGYYLPGPGAGLAFTPKPQTVGSASIVHIHQNATTGTIGDTIQFNITYNLHADVYQAMFYIIPKLANGTTAPGGQKYMSGSITASAGSNIEVLISYTVPKTWTTGYYWFELGSSNNSYSTLLLWTGTFAAFGVNSPNGNGSQLDSICAATAGLISPDDFSIDPPQLITVPTSAPTSVPAPAPVSSSPSAPHAFPASPAPVTSPSAPMSSSPVPTSATPSGSPSAAPTLSPSPTSSSPNSVSGPTTTSPSASPVANLPPSAPTSSPVVTPSAAANTSISILLIGLAALLALAL